MKINWRQLVSINEINSTQSVGQLKTMRRALKKQKDLDVHEKMIVRRKIDALILAKQHAYFVQHQKNTRFSWLKNKYAYTEK